MRLTAAIFNEGGASAVTRVSNFFPLFSSLHFNFNDRYGTAYLIIAGLFIHLLFIFFCLPWAN